MNRTRLSIALVITAAILATARGGTAMAQTTTSTLPPSVWSAVSADAASRTGIAASEVVLLRYVAVTFSDGCLGLGQANEACLAALTDGWVVWVSAGDTVLHYHTSVDGSQVRLSPRRPGRAQVLSEPLPQGAQDRASVQDRDRIGRVVSGEAPQGGGFGLVVFGGGTAEQLRAAVACGPVLPMSAAFWATLDGEFVVYVPAAQVGAVNERWHTAFRLGIPPNTPLLLRCR